jgi:hypothetical protein
MTTMAAYVSLRTQVFAMKVNNTVSMPMTPCSGRPVAAAAGRRRTMQNAPVSNIRCCNIGQHIKH